MRCKHNKGTCYRHRCSAVLVEQTERGRAGCGVGGMWWHECGLCGAYLPLGPSNDEPEQVRVEIRAAEIAASGRPETCGETYSDADCEECGWDEHSIYCPPAVRAGYLAGYLARCIAEHNDGGTDDAG